MTSNPGFKVTVYLQVEYPESQKRCVSGTKLLKNTNRKPYTIYRMVPLLMTLSDLRPRFQGHDIFRHWISQKRHERQSHSYYRMLIGSRMRSIEWWFLWPWRTPNPVFKVTAFLKSNISGTKLLKNTNRKPYTICLLVPFSMTLSDLWPDLKVTTFSKVEYRKNGAS